MWLREQGCPLNGKTLWYVLQYFGDDVCEWLLTCDEFDDDDAHAIGDWDDEWGEQGEDYWEDFMDYYYDDSNDEEDV